MSGATAKRTFWMLSPWAPVLALTLSLVANAAAAAPGVALRIAICPPCTPWLVSPLHGTSPFGVKKTHGGPTWLQMFEFGFRRLTPGSSGWKPKWIPLTTPHPPPLGSFLSKHLPLTLSRKVIVQSPELGGSSTMSGGSHSAGIRPPV